METSEVRRQVTQTIERARSAAAKRRARADEARRDFAVFLERIAVPIMRQVAGALKAQSYSFTVFTPSDGVRLMSDRAQQDFIELSLDTSGDEPRVLGRVSRERGRRLIETECPVAAVPVADLTDEDVLQFLVKELEPFVER